MDYEDWLLITGLIAFIFLIKLKGTEWAFEMLLSFYVANTLLWFVARKIHKRQEKS